MLTYPTFLIKVPDPNKFLIRALNSEHLAELSYGSSYQADFGNLHAHIYIDASVYAVSMQVQWYRYNAGMYIHTKNRNIHIYRDTLMRSWRGYHSYS